MSAGLIVPEMLADGRVCVDMGKPVLEGPKVPTTLAPTQGSTVVGQVRLHAANAAHAAQTGSCIGLHIEAVAFLIRLIIIL